MALTRAMLKGMELSEEQIGAIIEEHTAVTSALKEQRDEYKKDASRLTEVQKSLEDLQKEYNEYKDAVAKDDWQKKYEKEHSDFEKYKSDIDAKESSAKTKEAYKKLLVECGVGEKYLDSILRVTQFEDIKLKDDGTLDDADKLKESIASDWSGFIPTKGTKGADVETPPAGDNPDNGNTGRAAQLAAKYRENLYGKVKEE